MKLNELQDNPGATRKKKRQDRVNAELDRLGL